MVWRVVQILVRGTQLQDGAKQICVCIFAFQLGNRIRNVIIYSLVLIVDENCLDAPVSSRIQLKVKLPIVDINSCNDTYRPYSLNLAQSQICAGGDKGLDACLGDSGGPLMFLDKSRASWVLSGVVSLGLKKCGVAGVPGIYTKVENYVDWIEKKIR